jgi:hypothetical protein
MLCVKDKPKSIFPHCNFISLTLKLLSSFLSVQSKRACKIQMYIKQSRLIGTVHAGP